MWAVVGWNIDRWVIHVMAPEIRAALEQLRHLTLGGMCTIAHKPGEDCHMPRCFDSFDEELTPLTHPTSTVLVLVPEAAGDEVRSLHKLCVLLHVLSGSYAGALDMEISWSDPNATESVALAIAKQADSPLSFGTRPTQPFACSSLTVPQTRMICRTSTIKTAG